MRILCVLMVALYWMAAAQADSLFNAKVAKDGTLISNKQKRFEVGDIITVLVQEKIQAQTESNTNTKKESEIQSEASADENTFLTAAKPTGLALLAADKLPVWHVDSENEHRTTGKTQRSNTLTTTITCTVKEVLPNNNLRIEGSKRVSVNREDSDIEISGVIRPRDVSASNTILSSQVAEASIELKGRGPLWNNQRRGILTKLLDWFSPF